jgi:hypothetical protein
MRRFVSLAILVALGYAPLAWGIPSARVPAIEPFIQQLGDRNFRVRDAAAKAILAHGPRVMPALQKAKSYPDTEVRRRVNELYAQLERMAALTPKEVTLHVTDKPAKEVLAELARQTGYKIVMPDGSPPEQSKKLQSFHFDKLHFWQAVDQICEAGGLTLLNNGDETFRLAYQDGYVPFRSYDGTFKVMATGFHYNRNNDFSAIPRNRGLQGQNNYESLQINFLIAVEPRLPLLKVGRVRLTVAEDEDKRSMLLNGNGGYNPWDGEYYYGGSRRSYIMNASAWLTWPAKSARTVKTLKGIIPVTLLSEQRPTVVTDKLQAAKGQKFHVGSASFTVNEVVVKPNKQYELKMSYAESETENPYDWNQLYSLRDRMTFQDEKGNKIPTLLNITQYNNATSCEFTISSSAAPDKKIGPPAKLIFQQWIKMGHEVAFEFKDLPLP